MPSSAAAGEQVPVPPLKVLAINPGSTTTRLALFSDGREIFSVEAPVDAGAVSGLATTVDQVPLRREAIRKALSAAGRGLDDLAAVVARGGPMAPVPGGTYRVNPAMLADARSERHVDHVSRIGCILADELAGAAGAEAFVVDPVSTDEYRPPARVSGLPELPRRSLTHALNIRACARRYAAECARDPGGLNLIVAHLGGGISIAAVESGRMVDSVDANGEGPMSPERSGGLRVDDLVDLCFSGAYSRAELKRKLTRGGGLVAHTGTSDAVRVEKLAASGDQRARACYEAMAYQVSKHVASMAAVLCGRVDAVILTGGLARSEVLTSIVRERVSFLGEVRLYPGEDEMRALCEGALRVLRGEERPRVYPSGREEG